MISEVGYIEVVARIDGDLLWTIEAGIRANTIGISGFVLCGWICSGEGGYNPRG
jgi:hypothetical protein